MNNDIQKILNPGKDIIESLVELKLDSVITDEFLRGIPGVSMCRSVVALSSGIQQFHFLRKFYDFHLEEQKTKDEDELQELATRKVKLNYSLLSGTGLLSLPSGAGIFGARGGARLNDLGIKYCKEVLGQLEYMAMS